MKIALGFALVLCAASTAAIAQEPRVRFCRSTADDFTSWTVRARADLKAVSGTAAPLQLQIARREQYAGVVSRVAARANMLLTSELTEAEIRADLYGLCMSVY